MASIETRIFDAREREAQAELAMRDAKEQYKAALRIHRAAQQEVYELEREQRTEILASEVSELEQTRELVGDTKLDLGSEPVDFDAVVDTLLQEL